MNPTKYGPLWLSTPYAAMLWLRALGGARTWNALGKRADAGPDTIATAYVINLDTDVSRWSRMRRELGAILDSSGVPLTQRTTRFSAIDARRSSGYVDPSELVTTYSLADQLFVDPEPSLHAERFDAQQTIQMSRQEIAVARSHIEIWKLVASGDAPHTLVLEDDVYFRLGFTRLADTVWREVHDRTKELDVLYLSFEEAKTRALRTEDSGYVFRPLRGLWQLSGYVLSRPGAQRLLELLPVKGPVDLWINHQFDKLNVYASSKALIRQRGDVASTNSYSVLPVLAGLGLYSREKPRRHRTGRLPRPIFAAGEPGSGLTSLAMALSMLGYRCCSDLRQLPAAEQRSLLGGRRDRVFDAYVNVLSLSERWLELARIYPRAKFILMAPRQTGTRRADGSVEARSPVSPFVPPRMSPNWGRLLAQGRIPGERLLILSSDGTDRWESLCRFLDCLVPSSPYPELPDSPPRTYDLGARLGKAVRLRLPKWDKLPWILPPSSQQRSGGPRERSGPPAKASWVPVLREQFHGLDTRRWELLQDTFPGNRALFREGNFSLQAPGSAVLQTRTAKSKLREFTSASLRSREAHLYGRFEADVKPARAAGLVTGIFLHRNSPRQEIDVELLGKNTRKLMVNVYYNPGTEGTPLEYGYRGTPTFVDLGFDASESFHRYSIAWTPTSIEWLVDDRLVLRRENWDPTPIPHLPMRFHINLWPPRSRKLAGVLRASALPASSHIRSVRIDTWK